MEPWERGTASGLASWTRAVDTLAHCEEHEEQAMLKTPLIALSGSPLVLMLSGCMSIQTAAAAGNVGEVRRQLAWGANPDSRTFWYHTTPLHAAASNGRLKVVELLLAKGADVNIGNEGSETPLHHAARHGHTDVVQVLLDNGANVAEAGTGCGTPLQWATSNGQLATAKLLLEHEADVNQRGANGHTALHGAAARGELKMVQFLLSAGAQVNALADYGCTPLHSAVGADHVTIAGILLDHGADVAAQCNGRTALQMSKSGRMSRLLYNYGASE